MATATIYRMYELNLDTDGDPEWNKMSPRERLRAWLAMARDEGDEAFKNMVQTDVDGVVINDND